MVLINNQLQLRVNKMEHRDYRRTITKKNRKKIPLGKH